MSELSVEDLRVLCIPYRAEDIQAAIDEGLCVECSEDASVAFGREAHASGRCDDCELATGQNATAALPALLDIAEAALRWADSCRAENDSPTEEALRAALGKIRR